MLTVKIYAIVNPITDEVIYIGASTAPKKRYCQHIKLKGWPKYVHRFRQMKAMLSNDVKPELLILDTVDFPDVQFFEEFYMQLFKTWGYKIQQDRSGYQTNKKFFYDNEMVYLPKFGFYGIVVHHEDELYVKVFIDKTQRVMTIFVNDVERINKVNAA